MSEINVNESLREVATIVVFSSRVWGARAKDQKVVHDAAQAAKAQTDDVGTFTKKLLAGADTEYKALCKKINEARSLHYTLTLPYTRGQALLPNVQMLDYVQKMMSIKDEIKVLKDEFKAVYPDRRDEAIRKLGALADPAKYPPVESIDSSFGIDIEFLPIPVCSDFSYLPEGFATRLGMDLEDKLNTRIKQAKDFGWARLNDALEHAAEKCLDLEVKRLFASMVRNVNDAATVLRGFYEDGTPEYSLLSRIVNFSETVTINDIRNSQEVRRNFGENCKNALIRSKGVHGEA